MCYSLFNITLQYLLNALLKSLPVFLKIKVQQSTQKHILLGSTWAQELTLMDTEHCRPGTLHKSSSFGAAPTQSLWNLLPIFSASNTSVWDKMFTCSSHIPLTKGVIRVTFSGYNVMPGWLVYVHTVKRKRLRIHTFCTKQHTVLQLIIFCSLSLSFTSLKTLQSKQLLCLLNLLFSYCTFDMNKCLWWV